MKSLISLTEQISRFGESGYRYYYSGHVCCQNRSIRKQRCRDGTTSWVYISCVSAVIHSSKYFGLKKAFILYTKHFVVLSKSLCSVCKSLRPNIVQKAEGYLCTVYLCITKWFSVFITTWPKLQVKLDSYGKKMKGLASSYLESYNASCIVLLTLFSVGWVKILKLDDDISLEIFLWLYTTCQEKHQCISWLLLLASGFGYRLLHSCNLPYLKQAKYG